MGKEVRSNDRKERLGAMIPEVPLAFGHPENSITEQQVSSWLDDVAWFIKQYPDNTDCSRLMTGNEFDPGKAVDIYQRELHFLSREDTENGLRQFADEITESFDPQNTLFYFPPESQSASLLYRNMEALKPEIGQYGKVRDGYHLSFLQKNKFNSDTIDNAQSFLYVDDWILSGEHMGRFLTTDVAGKFNTFHMVVSSKGENFLDATSEYISPRYMYTVPSETGFFPEVPLYGFHKIPDRLPKYYASEHGAYSIFGEDRGVPISAKRRLVDHNGLFVTAGKE